jgi:glycine/D-amino acid oxidase-like deaminating enzyme
MTDGAAERCDAVVVGGGFYGCCLALFLRGIADNVVLVEAEKDLLTRASYVNQARIHTGFHYPRSFVTARRSLALYQRFMAEFADAVVDDFTMLYAIARSGSKVTPQRFVKMFEGMGAPIAPASAAERALFEPRLIADVLRCREYAFDASRLRLLLRQRLERAGVRLLNGTRVETIRPARPPAPITVTFADRPPLAAPMVFDATYGQFALQQGGNYQAIPLKYELAEIALVTPPPELAGLGVTVMDGPFFSIMPFPARGCYSLTHVRYTPHRAWTSREVPALPAVPVTSAWMHMQRDAMRYLPALSLLQWHESLYEVKTVLLRNESDDGRPILLHRNTVHPNYMTVLGGKLDNVYDLFEALIALGPPFNRAMAAAATADPQ